LEHLHKWEFLQLKNNNKMEISVPDLSLVLLVGASGSGKSTFARAHFAPYEIVSSDECRAIVSNDENSKDATNDAFDLLYYIVGKRLKRGLLTVVDATNVQASSRKGLVALAREYHALPVVIVLDMSQSVCETRNKARADRDFGAHVVRQQLQQLKKSMRGLKREGFRKIYRLKSAEEVEGVTGVVREKLYNDKKHISGPFDIIGDIHGCYDETVELLTKLGYELNTTEDNGRNFGLEVSHPEHRQVIFLGDLVDRGPNSPAVLKLVMSMVNSGVAWCVPGNHDLKLQKKLKGKQVSINHGLAETLEQLEAESPAFIDQVKEFLYGLVSHYVFDEGKLVVSHAGIKEEMQGRGSGAVRSFCLYGETTGEIDEFGLPVRYDWASEYRGKAKVVYGHTPVPEAEWLNKTIDIDTGCVFGGKLTALRYPEETLVSVPAKKVYCEPARPLEPPKEQELSNQQAYDDLLAIEDVTGKRIVQTRLRNNLTIQEENSISALEVMSRFAINPKWLIYLPPTMSPCGASELPDFLEHPQQAINYYKSRGIEKIVCEEKHMGSRVVLVVCRDESVVQARFGVLNEGIGVAYTRTGRSFFNDNSLETAFLARVNNALTKADFWETHQTDWVCLDTELMPWSAKAQALLQNQYASVGASAQNALFEVNQVLQQAVDRGIADAQDSLKKFAYKQTAIGKYQQAYRNYCWEVNSVEDYKLAPFHILATEGAVHTDKNHAWHMEQIAAICKADPQMFRATPYKVVETGSEASVQAAIDWWMELTAKGGEGMVVKPYDFIVYGSKDGLLQPAVKCRGSEYLRIIYGPEYDMPANLVRLKNRALGRKRSLALREFALGIEALERFVQKEPLRRVHEAVFGVLALESEEVDPRL
jgi:protein phosphatase